MLILALRHDPEHVYEEALKLFTEDDIAEAFAATRGITIPTQSRASHKEYMSSGGRDLIALFRELAPECEPISVQRWGRRRIGLALAAAFVGLIMFSFLFDNLTGAGFV